MGGRLSEHLTAGELERYRHRELPPVELMRVDDHVSVCESCRSELAASMDVEMLARSWQADLSERPKRTFSFRLVAVAATVVLCVAAAAVIRSRRQSPILARLQDGPHVIALDAAGRLTGMGGLTSEQEQSIRAALRDSKLNLPDTTAWLVGRTEVLMGQKSSEADHTLVSPWGTAILEDQPLFRWKPLPGARAYIVVIQEEGSGEIIRSQPVAGTEWKTAQPLGRGRRYAWQLVVESDAGERSIPKPPEPPARFSIVATEVAEGLSRLPDSQVARGVLYAEAGLLDAARTQFEALSRENPESPAVRGWLEALRQQKTPK